MVRFLNGSVRETVLKREEGQDRCQQEMPSRKRKKIHMGMFIALYLPNHQFKLWVKFSG